MKPKGISLLELHCEKLFLAILALAALVVVAMQFTGEGNTVRVGSVDDVRLDRAYEMIAGDAESKLGQLEQERANPQTPSAEVSYVERFAAALEREPATLAEGPISAPWPEIGGDPITEDDLIVEAVEVGAPAPPETDVFLGTISPSATRVEAFEEIYGAGPWPRDVRAITVSTSFDAERLRERLLRDPDGTGPAQPAPIGFWRGRHAIAAVSFERQRLLENGDWSDPEPVPPPPGALDLTELVVAAQEADQVAEVMGLIKSDRAWEIVRPNFTQTVAPSYWSPPGVEERIDAGEAPEEVEREIAAWAVRGTNLREIAEMPLWTIDYRVEPGETYRYRSQVWIPNPYYGFAPALAEISRELAEDPFLQGEASDWGDPVTAPREAYWFAFSAASGLEGPLAGQASCRLDVFGFVGGRWRMKQERFEPGDPIRVTLMDDTGVERVVDTGAQVLDVAPAMLTEPDARGRQEPMQVVATTDTGLVLREVWRDRASEQRRELLNQIEAAEPSPAVQPEPETTRERERAPGREGSRLRDGG